LNTERQSGGGSIGPIPASKVEARSDRLGLAPDVAELFELCILKMDAGYRGWQADEFEAERARQASEAKRSRGGKRSSGGRRGGPRPSVARLGRRGR